jgi:hypothetical protein
VKLIVITDASAKLIEEVNDIHLETGSLRRRGTRLMNRFMVAGMRGSNETKSHHLRPVQASCHWIRVM